MTAQARRPAATPGRLAFAAGALVLFDVAAPLLVFGAAAVTPVFDPRWVRTAIFAAVYVGMNLLALVAAYELAFTRRRADVPAFGLGSTARVPSSLLLFLGAQIVVLPVALALTDAFGLGGTTAIDTSAKPLRYRVFIAVLAVLVAPWIEEIAMRGLLFGALLRRFGFWPAAAGSAAVWAGLHLTPGVLILFTAEGVLLAWVRQRTGSVLTGVGLHGAQNTLSTALTGGGWAPAPIAGLLLLTLVAAPRVVRRAAPVPSTMPA